MEGADIDEEEDVGRVVVLPKALAAAEVVDEEDDHKKAERRPAPKGLDSITFVLGGDDE